MYNGKNIILKVKDLYRDNLDFMKVVEDDDYDSLSIDLKEVKFR